jgi:hypothetical protein
MISSSDDVLAMKGSKADYGILKQENMKAGNG